MERSYRREAESAEKNALREDAKVVSATRKLADVASAVSSAQSSLEREIKAADGRRAREESSAASKRRQDDDRRRREELSHARAVAQAKGQTLRVVHVAVPPAEKLTVLLMTANPLNLGAMSPENATLWTEREVRDAQRAVERAKHRDRLTFITRPAAQQEDLLDQLNLYTPEVFHFAGHGSVAGIYFETDDRGTKRLLSGDILNRVLAALDSPPRLVLLNACDTAVVGKLLADSGIEAVVSMDQPISDTAARLFTEQFYSAVASGQSLMSCFNQATTKLAMAGLPEDEIPVLSCADGVDPKNIVLVQE